MKVIVIVFWDVTLYDMIDRYSVTEESAGSVCRTLRYSQLRGRNAATGTEDTGTRSLANFLSNLYSQTRSLFEE
jgi:hypothetical protein